MTIAEIILAVAVLALVCWCWDLRVELASERVQRKLNDGYIDCRTETLSRQVTEFDEHRRKDIEELKSRSQNSARLWRAGEESLLRKIAACAARTEDNKTDFNSRLAVIAQVVKDAHPKSRRKINRAINGGAS